MSVDRLIRIKIPLIKFNTRRKIEERKRDEIEGKMTKIGVIAVALTRKKLALVGERDQFHLSTTRKDFQSDFDLFRLCRCLFSVKERQPDRRYNESEPCRTMDE